jgi:pimeloyl-ACP methyl ester carboxylesterase
VPALFIWADRDTIVPAAFARHVASWLPAAEQVTLEMCGHVPQVERPRETNELLMNFFARVAREAKASPARSRPSGRRPSQAA